MNHYRITLAYDGTDFAGWQIQPGEQTVQAVLEDALAVLFREPVRLHCSGRTDRGVHARAQEAHFTVGSPFSSPQKLRFALNGILPDTIRILRAVTADETFHARFSAIGKEYRYFIWNGEVMPPFLRKYRLHVRRKLDIDAMRAAAERLQGTRDFAAFTANPNREVETTVRTLRELVVLKKGREVVIRAVADGFLYKMVRSLAGGLVRAGLGELSPDDLSNILESRERTARIPTALPQGLFLWKVHYSRQVHRQSMPEMKNRLS